MKQSKNFLPWQSRTSLYGPVFGCGLLEGLRFAVDAVEDEAGRLRAANIQVACQLLCCRSKVLALRASLQDDDGDENAMLLYVMHAITQS